MLNVTQAEEELKLFYKNGNWKTNRERYLKNNTGIHRLSVQY
jgi:hypothetical protein